MTCSPYDEPAIKDSDLILRRVNPETHVIYDKNKNCHRISSKLYSMSSGTNMGMSVDVESLIVQDNIDPHAWVKSPPFMGAVSLEAGDIRSLNLQVGYDPIPSNKYHGEVWSKDQVPRFTKSQRKGLAIQAIWYETIPNVQIR